ncbi:MAG: DUF4065 domain-containing protein [Desulfobacterales bacterium]|nr:DUF4065 domain-containing protein [Desulfobacterales bacterium]
MANEKIERICEILSFVLHLMKNGEVFSKTKLAKLLYLLDVVKSRQRIPKFSGIKYTSYYYGPFSDDIEESISLLTTFGHITVTKDTSFDGNPYYHIKLNQLPNFGYLTDQEKMDIKKIISPLINRELNELLEITYNTKEYKNAPFGELISLST